jgi:hypothetical protein
MNDKTRIERKIAKLQRKLEEIEKGIYHVYDGESPKFSKNTKEIHVHALPPTVIYFEKDHITFMCSEHFFQLDIVPVDTNGVFTMRFVR